MRRRYPGDSKSAAQNCLRCYGYGVPDLGKALSSAENAATLIYEGDIQPFRKEGSSCKANEMHLHEIPWPTEVLEELVRRRSACASRSRISSNRARTTSAGA